MSSDLPHDPALAAMTIVAGSVLCIVAAPFMLALWLINKALNRLTAEGDDDHAS